MQIEETGSVVSIDDQPGSLFIVRLLALTVAGAFWLYAINLWIAYFTEPFREIMPALGATVAMLFAIFVALQILKAPRVTTTIDRDNGKVTVMHERVFGASEVVAALHLDDIVKVDLRGPTEEDGYFVSLVRRTGPPIEISRFSQSHAAAQDVVAMFDALRRTRRDVTRAATAAS